MPEPTPDAVSQVQNFNDAGGGVPAPQMQPPAPTAQPAPSQQPAAPTTPTEPVDPFSSLFAEPAASTTPTEPATPTEPVAPTEPATPTPQPSQPAEPKVQPTPPEEKYESYQDYIARVTRGVPKAPEQPDPSKINPDDPQAIKRFFDDLVNTAVEKATASNQRSQAIQTSERKLWDAAFEQYGSLRTNKKLRDMVHAIRMDEFRKGVAITPTQAADRLLDALRHERKQGAADSAVITTIEEVQPNGGGGAPVPTTLDKENILTAVQTGGETALADYLDGEVKAGRL